MPGFDDEAARALETVRLLADEVGPRRPTGDAERLAASRIAELLGEKGIEARLEDFYGYASFGYPFGAVAALGLLPALLPRAAARLRSLPALAAAVALATEGGLRWTPVSAALSRRRSQNMVATIEPAGEPARTVCLIAHLDSSRSGLLFHPRLVRWLVPWINVQTAATLVGAAEPVLGRFRPGRRLLVVARSILAAGLALLAERELRGSDVPGANDNASGVAVCVELARHLALEPLAETRVVILLTGCEESGMLGSRAFLRSHSTSGWLFLNFDNVGAGTLRFLCREGLARKWEADRGLVAVADALSRSRPELGLRPAREPIGLTYDVTPVLASGGRGLTFVAAEGDAIPNYHWPTDTPENVDGGALGRAIGAGRKMLAAIDAGGADGQRHA